MTKKKPVGLTYQDLVKLIEEKGLPEDAFDGDLQDACEEEAEMMLENLQQSDWQERLEFLYLHGFKLKRLEELIREYKPETE